MRARRRGPIAGLLLMLVCANLAAWAWAFAAFRHAPALLGTSLLAYGLGLRHAVDADHIAAIDNVTRKLIQDRGRPLYTGLFFSLGHSTVVFIVSIAAALTANSFGAGFAGLRGVGGLVGTAVSGAFLLTIAAANLAALVSTHRAYRQARGAAAPDLPGPLPAAGPISRMLRRLFGLISRSWQMYPLGFLFGLGFDTASEVALLSISAVEASKGLSLSAALAFPALFTAGMSLVDTADGLFMAEAYAWAYVKPARKLFYNMAITAISAGVAFLVGGVELAGLVGSEFGFGGAFWRGVAWLNGNFLALGCGIIAAFMGCWLVFAGIQRFASFGVSAPGDAE